MRHRLSTDLEEHPTSNLHGNWVRHSARSGHSVRGFPERLDGDFHGCGKVESDLHDGARVMPHSLSITSLKKSHVRHIYIAVTPNTRSQESVKVLVF